MNVQRTKWHRLALGVGGLLLGGLMAQEPAPAEPAAPESAPLRDALRAAEDVAERVRGLEGAERLPALEQAARAYEEVGTKYAGAGPAVARAWWEAGELWRRHGSLALAEKAYQQALERDPTRYGERAWLELGHVQRRTDRADEALASYGKAAAVRPASARAHEARLWIGRTHAQGGKLQDAITAYRAALEATDHPGRVVEACDMLAMAQIKAGDLGGAAESVRLADSQLSKVEGPAADRLKRALDGMSARRSLQRAQDKQSKAAVDADRLQQADKK